MAAGGRGYFAKGYFHDNYWANGPSYWAEADAEGAVVPSTTRRARNAARHRRRNPVIAWPLLDVFRWWWS